MESTVTSLQRLNLKVSIIYTDLKLFNLVP